MPRVVREVHIDASPERVWEVVGDAGGVADWLPAAEASSLDGDTRTVELAGGSGTITERILARDDASRRLEYTIVESPRPLESHRSSMEVLPDGEGTRFVWTTDVEPQAAAEGMTPVFDGGVEALKRHIEGS